MVTTHNWEKWLFWGYPRKVSRFELAENPNYGLRNTSRCFSSKILVIYVNVTKSLPYFWTAVIKVLQLHYERHLSNTYLSVTWTSMTFPLLLDAVVLNSQVYFLCLDITGNKLKWKPNNLCPHYEYAQLWTNCNSLKSSIIA